MANFFNNDSRLVCKCAMQHGIPQSEFLFLRSACLTYTFFNTLLTLKKEHRTTCFAPSIVNSLLYNHVLIND